MAWQRSFRPLTGMVQIWNELFRDQNLFSPPYGDGTIRPLLNTLQRVFSPPYGDSTQGANISIWINGVIVCRWVTEKKGEYKNACYC